MSVKLISYSQPTVEMIESDIKSVMDLVAFCSRVSNPDNQYNIETYQKLVKYLIKHKHWSPFELVSVCMEIDTTRDIGRQILRHRSFSFNEFSQRYANPLEELEFVFRDARLQDEKNRQNSIELDTESEEHQHLEKIWRLCQENVLAEVKKSYKWAIENGIAKEQARAILPEGLTKSRLYVNGTLRSWIHYVELRSEHGTQLEHIEIAKECAKVINTIFPMENF